MDTNTLLLVPIVILAGTASSTLAVSAYSVLLPVLATGYKLDIFTSLFICFLVDFSNGIILSVQYRKYLGGRENLKQLLFLGLFAMITAGLVSEYVGLHFVKVHEERLKSGVGYADFLLGAVFFFRAFKLHKEEKSVIDVENEEDVDIYLQVSTNDTDINNDNQTPLIQNVQCEYGSRPLPPILSIGTLKMVLVIIYIGGLSGILGFGGGNFVAVVWMFVFKWQTLPGTAAGSLIASFLMSALIVVYLVNDKVKWKSGSQYIATCLITNIISALIASRYAKRLSEKWLCLSVAVLCTLIGIFVTVFSIEEK